MNIRKLFFSFLFLIASFILIDNVNAKDFILDYNREELEIFNQYQYVVDELINIADNYNTNGYAYFISFERVNNSRIYMYYDSSFVDDNYVTDYVINIGIIGATNNYFGYAPYYSTSSSYLYYDYDLFDGNNINSSSVFQYHYSIAVSDISNNSILNNFYNLAENVFKNGGSAFIELTNSHSVRYETVNLINSNSFTIPVYSNLPFVFAQANTRYTDTLTIDNTLYNYGDLIPTYYEYFGLGAPQIPTIDIEITDKEKTTINNVDYVNKKNIKLNLNNFDLNKHQLFLAFDFPRGFCEYIPDFLTSSYSFDVTKNTNIYVKIVDRETQEELYTTSINITDISVPIPNIDVSIIETEYLNNDTSLPALSKTVQFNFDYFNTDIYSYKYYDLDYNTVVNILENNHIANTHTNGSFIIYVYDKQTNELVKSSTLTITGLFGSLFPQISIKHNSYDYKYCGDEKRVYSQTLDITFSILDSTRYIYEYSIDNVNYIEYDIKNYVAGYYFEYTIFKNSTLYVRIKDKNTNEILDYKEFVVDSITFDSEDITCILGTDFNSNLSALQEYLVELKETSNAFNQIFNSFYKSIPTVVSQGLAYAYIIILVIVGLKLGGWK